MEQPRVPHRTSDEHDPRLADTAPFQDIPSVIKEPVQFGDRYRILRLLGEGGMGRVYLAEDRNLHRRVALKIPRFHPDQTKGGMEQFQREAQNAARLVHQSIAKVFDCGNINRNHYLTMEYVQGHSLKQYLGKAPLTERSVLRLVIKIAQGLQHAHEHSVVHRDIKPGNIMVDRKFCPKITDFGLAFQATQEQTARLTQLGDVKGTPAYMAPEQIEADPKKVGPLVDVYSLGVVLYEMLTGQLPFTGPSVNAVLLQVLTAQPTDPTKIRPDLNPDLATYCLQMLAKAQEDRPPSMSNVANSLHHLLAQCESRKSSEALKFPHSKSSITHHSEEVEPETPQITKLPFQNTRPIHSKSGRRKKNLQQRRWLFVFIPLAICCGVALQLLRQSTHLDAEASNTLAQVLPEPAPSPGQIEDKPPIALNEPRPESNYGQNVLPPVLFSQTTYRSLPQGLVMERSPPNWQVERFFYISDFLQKPSPWKSIQPSSGGNVGRWSYSAGVTRFVGAGNRMVTSRREFQNFVLRAEVRLAKDARGCLAFRTSQIRGRPRGYNLTLGANEVSFNKWGFMAQATPLERIPGDPLPVNEWFPIELQAMDNHLAARINGGSILEASDTKKTHMAGEISLSAHAQSSGSIEVRNIKVWEPASYTE